MPAYYDKERKYWSVQFRYTDWTGARKKKHKRGFKLKREAEEWEREFLLRNAGNPDMTFESLVERYYADMKNHIRASTLETKKSAIDTHILPYFKNKSVSEITNADVRQWQNTMLQKKQKNGDPYKPTYLRTLNSQLSAIFNFAVQYFKLPLNPCSQVKAMGKKQADEMNFWTLDEFNKALQYANGPAYRLAFLTLYWTGIREGELLAMTKKKIIHQDKALRVTQTLKRENGEMVLGDPKTENSVRIVTLPDFLYDEIQAYTGALYGLEDDDPIFYMSKHGLLEEIKRMADAAGLQRIRVHDLRHSHVALLIELGYRTHAIAQRIGDTPAEVDRTYAHLYPNKAHHIALELNKHRDGIVQDAVEVEDEDGLVYNEKELLEQMEQENKNHGS